MIRVPPSASRPRLTCLTDNASPPISNCFNPRSAVGSSSITALNNDAVSHSVVTPSRSIASPSSPAVGTPSRYKTHFPPCSSGPHSSSVEASNDTGANCKNTSSGPNSAYSTPNTSRNTPRCLTSTPFGTPVDPDVYVTYARSSRLAPLANPSTLSFEIAPQSRSTHTALPPSGTSDE